MDIQPQIQVKTRPSPSPEGSKSKRKRALSIIKCFTYTTETLMYIEAGSFIYSLANSGIDPLVLVSFLLDMAMAVSCGYCCYDTRTQFKKSPPEYRKGRKNVETAIDLYFDGFCDFIRN